MPRYYGQQIDPLEMQQMAGNPFYNPELSRPDWYRGIMSVYANLKGAKEEKEAKVKESEDREWQRMARELQKTSTELDIKQKKQEMADYRSPTWKEAMKILEDDRQHGYRMKEIYAQIEAQAKRDAERQSKTESDTTYQEKKRVVSEVAKDRLDKQKTYKNIVIQIESTKKRIEEVRVRGLAEAAKGNTTVAQGLDDYKEKLTTDLDTLEGLRQGYLEELVPSTEKTSQPDYSKRLPANLPGAGPGINYGGENLVPPVGGESGRVRTYAKDKLGNRIYTEDGKTWINDRTGKLIK